MEGMVQAPKRRAQKCQLVGPNGEATSIPESVFYVLERVAEELAFDPAVSTQHGPALQMIDGVVQGLSKLALNAGASLPSPARVRG